MKILSREDLRNQLIKGEIATVYLLFGEETYLRDLAAKTIIDRALTDSGLREFNETAFSLADSRIEYALAAAEQMPMVSSRRVVKITEVVVSGTGKKDSLKEEDETVLMRYLARPSETSVVIFVANELDKRRKISKLLLENCVSVEFTPLSDNELIDEVKKQLKKTNAQIEDRAARYLVGLVGNDLQKLMTEAEKLATAALPDSLITFELVEQLVPNSRELSNFELTDYLLAKNRTRSLQILHKILDDGAEPLMLLGLIANNFHRLFLAKELMRNGVDRNEVARTMRLPFSKQEDFLATARRADAERLSWNLQRIAQTDLAIKTSQATPRLQIEMLVCELTG
ncbi:MAG TPA: DNA polymerase III subunit delta [Pyrinomonadaceae bacterium]|jgi:DNA polymerase-3 subunit delta